MLRGLVSVSLVGPSIGSAQPMKKNTRQRPADAEGLIRMLWQFCGVLRDDGLSYPDYVEQLTYLLFLKMAYEQSIGSRNTSAIPSGFDWRSLTALRGTEQHAHYGETLRVLAGGKGMLGLIFR